MAPRLSTDYRDRYDVPAFKGGQGRSDDEVAKTFDLSRIDWRLTLAITAIVAAVALVIAW